ncbi:MAG: DUF488 domain-containing protein [Oligoflexia bacterium]|nr:DUF488 domain-containing protein [Oligoflexia bacterium]
MIKMKRAYEPPERKDGYRVLIDRLWPRGIEKSRLALDQWIKDLAPSPELRKDFGHDPSRWKQFRARYRLELRSKAARETIDTLAKRASKSPVTLIYSARDEDHNNAVVLKEAIERQIKQG